MYKFYNVYTNKISRLLRSLLSHVTCEYDNIFSHLYTMYQIE